MTQKQFNRNVQAAIKAKLARAASGLDQPLAANLAAAQLLLDRAAIAQKAYWDALAALERELGFDINMDNLGELDAYTVADLYVRFA